jgi:5'-deoxynucleotidase YfbR-like HD superfamily hydrolase
MENLYTPDCIRTYTGKYLNLKNPNPEDIVIEDIAHALSQIPRFGGHLRYFYSVAQHSIFVSDICRNYPLDGLLHDASEAYLGDVTSPLKKLLPDYKIVEERLNQVIAKKFNITFPFVEEVVEADKKELEFEWDFLMINEHKQFISPINKTEQRFLNLFYHLTTL